MYKIRDFRDLDIDFVQEKAFILGLKIQYDEDYAKKNVFTVINDAEKVVGVGALGYHNIWYDKTLAFRNMLQEEVVSGNHNRPKAYPYLIAQAYFSTPRSMAEEMQEAGFSIINQHAVEGCIWFTPCLDEKWENEQSRKNLLDIIHLTEHEAEKMGMSPHFLVIAKKQT